MDKAQIQPNEQGSVSLAMMVYYKWLWADAWTYAPYFQLLSMSKPAAPAIGTATLKLRYGSGFWEDAIAMLDGAELETYSYCYIQVRGRYKDMETILWTGLIPAESFTLLGRTTAASTVDQILQANSLDLLLDTRPAGAWVEPVGGGDPVWIDYLPTFNQRYKQGGPIIGNSSDTPIDIGSALERDPFIFSADGMVWSNWDIMEYLLCSGQQDNGPLFDLGAKTEIGEMLNKIYNVYDFNSMTIRQALNILMSRSRGLSWTFNVAEDGHVEIVPFSLLDEPIKLGEITMPAAEKKVSIDLWTDSEQTEVNIVQDISNVYDKIIVRGARMKSCCSFRFDEKTLEKAWTKKEETAFKDAAKKTADYGDLTEDGKAELNDKFRAADRFERVFTTVRVPRTWDWKTGLSPKRLVNPLIEFTGEINLNKQAAKWNVDKYFLNWLPFQVGLDYSQGVPEDKNPTNAEPEFRRMFALVKDASDKFQYADKFEPAGASIRPLTREMGVCMCFRPAYLAAKNHWTQGTDEPGKYDYYIDEDGTDYETLVVTAFIETDQFVQLSYNLNNYENKRVLTISIPDAELWYIVPDTIIDIDENGTLIKYSAEAPNIIRDDRDCLRAVLVAALSWYSKRRNKVTITTKAITPGIALGTMLENVDVAGIGAKGSVVTSIVWNMQSKSPTTTIQTDFEALNIRSFFR